MGRVYGILTSILVAQLLVALAALFIFWERLIALTSMPTEGAGAPAPPLRLLAPSIGPDADVLLLLLVVVFAVMGSSIHALTSLATYVGNRRFEPSWTLWYLIRAPIGVALACVFYFLLRGGFFTLGSGEATPNPYLVGAMAALTGLFSKQATDKLEEVFDVLFKSKGDAKRADKLTDDELRVVPASLPVGTAEQRVMLSGAGLDAHVVVEVDGEPRRVRRSGAGAVEVLLEEGDLGAPGPLTFQVRRADEALDGTREVSLRRRPRIDAVAINGTGSWLLRGGGFVAGRSRAILNGERRDLDVRSSREAVLSVTEGELRDGGTGSVKVENPADLGGASDPCSLPVAGRDPA